MKARFMGSWEGSREPLPHGAYVFQLELIPIKQVFAQQKQRK